jgi:NADH:ubiquinone oxidoreductase subunit 6 (subunit J)
MVLFIFVVMILNRDDISRVSFRGIVTRSVAVLTGLYVMYLCVYVALWQERGSPLLSGPVGDPPEGFGTVAAVGASLFRDFVFPFEAMPSWAG